LAPKNVNKRLINIDYFIAEKLSELAPKNVNKRLTDRGGRAPGGGCSWECSPNALEPKYNCPNSKNKTQGPTIMKNKTQGPTIMKNQDTTFRTENDVRRAMREGLGSHARFIEPSAGSTLGLPDVFCAWPCGTSLFAELKLGTIKNGRIKIHLRPAQKQQIASLLADACRACIIVGIKGAEEMYILSLEEALMVSGAIKGAGISQEGLEKALKEYARK
jgi:hypothetical protein